MWTETKSVRQHFKHDIKRQPFYVSFILKNSYGRTVLVKKNTLCINTYTEERAFRHD